MTLLSVGAVLPLTADLLDLLEGVTSLSLRGKQDRNSEKEGEDQLHDKTPKSGDREWVRRELRGV